MNLFRICIGLIVCFLLGGVVSLSKADSPATGATPTPVKGNFEPGPILPAHFTVDPARVTVTQMTVITSTLSPISAQLPPKSALPGQLLRVKPAEIDPLAAYFIGVENFEAAFPQANWEIRSNTPNYYWGDVPCHPLEDAFVGFWSGWPAADGPNGLDPCKVTPDPYPNNLDTWLIYGPFNLQNVEYADVQFFFRMVSEQNFDFLFWGASTDGVNFTGFQTSGSHISGPYNDGYNEVVFDLTSHLGQPDVYVGFRFYSDGDTNNEGPFIDGINIFIREVGTTTVYLPMIIKSPPTPFTQLYITNTTGGNVIFTVANTPQGNIVCNVPTGQTMFCGQFNPGTYNATSNAAACPPPTTKSKTFAAGSVTLTVRCK